MKKIVLFLLVCIHLALGLEAKELFPDGTPVPDWFRQNKAVDIKTLGKAYRITDYGVVNDSTILQTEKIQSIIDQASAAGGGVVLIPKGTFLSGALFFKAKTHLFIEKDAVLKGSDDISNFPILPTRIEGQSINYFAALVNADSLDGFTVSGEGTIDGNGLRYWKSFWLRRKVNPNCTNIEELRPRLVYISNSKNVQLSGVKLVNSPFWTTHLYKCENVKVSDLYIFSPHQPVKAPSTDAIDIDACTNVHIRNCYFSVNDDAIALKGGKGPSADQDKNNGGNRNIIIEDCTYGFCHSALTCGSEAIHNRNIVLRRCTLNNAKRLLWLKMRPDTPQNYEYILVEDIKGDAQSFLYVKPWTQFFDMKGQTRKAPSSSMNVTMRNIALKCDVFFDVVQSDQYQLSDFTFENLDIQATAGTEIPAGYISNLTLKKVQVNGKKLK
ncbi:rhamnogalacturonidase [Pararcticibacter amylolyticus]|uniref:Exopolygalacturonase n=1 Tax=Pararcticibacter amylolyticus TaxID=2173175 RepID=A0A2U2PH57_9SPHI|nr:glycosyl hydrolase family 28 protein [Pararcticibacter amylolyticus]PWG80592.1 exopolygalacturonase [Pararcticibacter amylolyticus]